MFSLPMAFVMPVAVEREVSMSKPVMKRISSNNREIDRIGHGNLQFSIGLGDRDAPVLARKVNRQEMGRPFIDLDTGKIDDGEAVLRRQRGKNILLGDDTEPHEAFSDLSAVLFLVRQRSLELVR